MYTSKKFNFLDDEETGYGDGGGPVAPQMTGQQAYAQAPDAGGASDALAKSAPAAMTGNPYVMAATFAVNLLQQRAMDERNRKAQDVQIAQNKNQNEQSIYNNLTNNYGKALLR